MEEEMNFNDVNFDTYFKNYPNEKGYFGPYGGSYIPDELQAAMNEITESYFTICKSRKFINELRRIRKEFQGRPTPISHLERLSTKLGNVQLYAKREDLNHTGAHKLNHCMGEALLAKYMGKSKIIAETGAGQHGVALATAAAYFGLKCDIYMGAVDIKKQAPNVARMKILGANVISVTDGLQTLKEAVDAAFTAYAREYKDAIYCIGSCVGPHPFPMMVRDFQSVVGIEAREQFVEMTGELPDAVVACVGGGSNSMGMFSGFLNYPVDIYGVEPLGRGPKLGDHAASLTYGTEGIMHGFNSIMLKDENGEPAPVYSIASGLDYPSSGPEHAFLRDLGRVKYDVVDDEETIDAFYTLSRLEGIIPAIESSHAVAYAIKLAKKMGKGSILINLSGRGDKDMDYIIEKYGIRDVE
jgi:tryptophan synthase beta chain